MKIKIGNKIYDGEEEPVMVILTEQDRKNIVNMNPDATKYCVYPDEEISEDEVIEWMADDENCLHCGFSHESSFAWAFKMLCSSYIK